MGDVTEIFKHGKCNFWSDKHKKDKGQHSHQTVYSCHRDFWLEESEDHLISFWGVTAVSV